MAKLRTTWSSNSFVLAALVVIAAPSFAEAQVDVHVTEPSAADVESAKVQFTEGLALREKGDHAGALARFRAAYALVPTPITGVEVGRSLIATGHILEGRALLLEVSRMPKKPGESEHAQQARDDAADLAEKSRAQLVTLTVDTDASVEPTITIDDVAIPKDAALAPRVLDPGHHVVVVRARGKTGRAEMDLSPGEQHQIRVVADHDDVAAKPAETHFRAGAPFWVSVVVTGVGLVVGISTGVAALAVTGHLASECPSKKCPSSAYGDLDASLALGWTSTIGFAVAGAGAIASIVTFALGGKRDEAHTARVRIFPTLGGLSVSGAF